MQSKSTLTSSVLDHRLRFTFLHLIFTNFIFDRISSIFIILLQCEQMEAELVGFLNQRRATLRLCLDTLFSYAAVVIQVQSGFFTNVYANPLYSLASLRVRLQDASRKLCPFCVTAVEELKFLIFSNFTQVAQDRPQHRVGDLCVSQSDTWQLIHGTRKTGRVIASKTALAVFYSGVKIGKVYGVILKFSLLFKSCSVVLQIHSSTQRFKKGRKIRHNARISSKQT